MVKLLSFKGASICGPCGISITLLSGFPLDIFGSASSAFGACLGPVPNLEYVVLDFVFVCCCFFFFVVFCSVVAAGLLRGFQS